MAGRRRGDGDDDSTKKANVQRSEMSKLSPLTPTPRQAKHWAKQYRTAIATLSGSVLSTCMAVSGNRSFQRERIERAHLGLVPFGLSQNPHASVCVFLLLQLSMTKCPAIDIDSSISQLVFIIPTKRRVSKASGVVSTIL